MLALPQLGGHAQTPLCSGISGRSCVKITLDTFVFDPSSWRPGNIVPLGNSSPLASGRVGFFQETSHPHCCGFHIWEFTYLPRFICNSEMPSCGAFVVSAAKARAAKNSSCPLHRVPAERLSKAHCLLSSSHSVNKCPFLWSI